MEVGSGEGEGTRASACLSNRPIRRRDDVYAYAIAAISGIALFCSLPAAAGRHTRAREREYTRENEKCGAPGGIPGRAALPKCGARLIGGFFTLSRETAPTDRVRRARRTKELNLPPHVRAPRGAARDQTSNRQELMTRCLALW